MCIHPFTPGWHSHSRYESLWLLLQGSCKSVSVSSSSSGLNTLMSAAPDYERGGWEHFKVSLAAFHWFGSSVGVDSPFGGCGGAVGSWDVDELVFKNINAGGQWLCIYDLKTY